jgi:hypothetical protein
VHVPGKADLNLYAYVKGAILKAIDPLGLEPKVSDSNAYGISHDGATVEFLTPERVAVARVTPTAPASDAPTSFADQQVQQMQHAAHDSAIEMGEGPLRLASSALGVVGLDSAGELLGAAADVLASEKYGPPDDPVLNLAYDDHHFGSGLLFSALTAVAPTPKLGGMRIGTNDFEVSLLPMREKITYEVGQLTMKDSTYKALEQGGMVGNTVEAVLERGSHMLRQWGFTGTLARLNPLNLGKTVSTGATPAAQAVQQLAVPAAKAAVIGGRDPLEVGDTSDAD